MKRSRSLSRSGMIRRHRLMDQVTGIGSHQALGTGHCKKCIRV